MGESATDEVRLPLGEPVGGVVSVRAVVHRPTRATRLPVLLLPGAAGDPDHAGLVALAEVLAADGHPVVRATWPHREAGRRAAPRAESSVATVVRLLGAARALVGGDRWVVGGRSYGGRVASMAVAAHGGAGLGVAGLLLVAYPFRPPGGRDPAAAERRVAHWGAVDVPVLFVVGARDPLHDAAALAAHRGDPAGPVTVLEVAGGDHELAVRAVDAPDGRAQGPAAATTALAPALAAWCRALDAGPRRPRAAGARGPRGRDRVPD